MGSTMAVKNSRRRKQKADGEQEPHQTSDRDNNVVDSATKAVEGDSSHIAKEDFVSSGEADFSDIADGSTSKRKRKTAKRPCKDDSKKTSNISQHQSQVTKDKKFTNIVDNDHPTSPEVSNSSPVDGNDSDEGSSDTDIRPESMGMSDEIGYSAGVQDAAPGDHQDENYIDRSGVIFCSRIPPFMSLSKLRSYFSRYAKIGRIYAEPETINDYKRRVKMGGNKKLKFIHGWIEFLDKAIAKRVATQLNGQPVGEKKRHNFWRDDLWNLLYLPRYKFNDVMAYLREHKNDRKEKLSFHLANSRKDNYNYMEQLEAEKQHKAIEKRRKKQGLPTFKHQARIRSKTIPQKEDVHHDDIGDSEQSVPMGLLGAIVT